MTFFVNASDASLMLQFKASVAPGAEMNATSLKKK
jgi:hypothetical protein